MGGGDSAEERKNFPLGRISGLARPRECPPHDVQAPPVRRRVELTRRMFQRAYSEKGGGVIRSPILTPSRHVVEEQ